MPGIFVQKIAGGSDRLYELTIPHVDGRKAYYKLSVDPLKEALFEKACKDGLTVDLKDFGIILESYYMPNTRMIKATTEKIEC